MCLTATIFHPLFYKCWSVAINSAARHFNSRHVHKNYYRLSQYLLQTTTLRHVSEFSFPQRLVEERKQFLQLNVKKKKFKIMIVQNPPKNAQIRVNAKLF